MDSPLSVIHSRWNYTFNEFQFSSQEFYSSVEETISKRKMPDVKFKHISLYEKSILSAKRDYLRVIRKEFVFDICAAPFGTGFFVSYWFGEKAGFWTRLLSKIPFIGTYLASSSKKKTYFQLDTENMYKGGVHSSIMDAIDEISKTKGIRALSELDRKPTNA